MDSVTKEKERTMSADDSIMALKDFMPSSSLISTSRPSRPRSYSAHRVSHDRDRRNVSPRRGTGSPPRVSQGWRSPSRHDSVPTVSPIKQHSQELYLSQLRGKALDDDLDLSAVTAQRDLLRSMKTEVERQGELRQAQLSVENSRLKERTTQQAQDIAYLQSKLASEQMEKKGLLLSSPARHADISIMSESRYRSPRRGEKDVSLVKSDDGEVEGLRRELSTARGTVHHLQDLLRQAEADKQQLQGSYFQKLELEKELQQAREELNSTRQLVDEVKSELEGERMEKVRMAAQRKQEVEAASADTNHQIVTLREQLATARSMEVAASHELSKATEEFTQRKDQLLHLLDTERKEKARMLEEYRAETENMLEEQQHRINQLQSALNSHHQKEALLMKDVDQLKAEVALRKEQVVSLEASLDSLKEEHRSERQKDIARAEGEIEKLKLDAANRDEEHSHALSEMQRNIQSLEDSNRLLQTQLHRERDRHQTLHDEAAAQHAEETSRLQTELQLVRNEKAQAAEEYKDALERMSLRSDEVADGLRRELEAARRDRQRAFDEHREEKDRMMMEQDTRVKKMQSMLEQVRKELSTERQGKKELEADHHALKLHDEQLASDVMQLRVKLEQQAEQARVAARAAATKHEQELSKARKEAAAAAMAVQEANQEVQKLDDENRRLADEADTLSHKLREQEHMSQRKYEQMLSDSEVKFARVEAARQELSEQVDRQQARRLELEEEVAALRHTAADERQALRETRRLMEEQSIALRKAEDEVASLQSSEANLAQLNDERSKQVQRLVARISEKEGELAAAESSKTKLQEELTALAIENDKIQEQMRLRELQWEDERETQNRDLADELTRLRVRVDSLVIENDTLQGSLQDSEATIGRLRREIRKAQDESTHNQTAWRLRSDAMSRDQSEFVRKLQQHIDELNTRIVVMSDDKLRETRALNSSIRKLESRIHELTTELEMERANCETSREELRAKDSVLAEKSSTVSMLQSRVQSKSTDLGRLESDVKEMVVRLQSAHSELDRKEMLISQLQARLRAAESRA